MPYLGDAGFHSYAQLPQIEADPAHDVNPPAEIPFVPQSMWKMTFNLNYHHHLQGAQDISKVIYAFRLMCVMKIAHAEGVQPEMDNVPDDQVEDHTLAVPMDITLTQPVESQSPTMVEERTLVPQIGGGVHDIHQSEARSSTQPPEQLISLPARPFQREFTPDEGEAEAEAVDDTMDWFQQEEPVRRRRPRQLRSRTIGQVTWDSKFGYRNYDVEEGILSGEFQELLPTESQGSWYGMATKERWTDQVRQLLYDPKPSPEETTDMRVGQEIPLTENLVVTGTVQDTTTAPPIISLEGPDVEPETGSFAVLSQYLINKMDRLERQFQKWYASLMLGLGTHLEQVNSSIEAIYQMGLTKREAKKDEFYAHKKGRSPWLQRINHIRTENPAWGQR